MILRDTTVYIELFHRTLDIVSLVAVFLHKRIILVLHFILWICLVEYVFGACYKSSLSLFAFLVNHLGVAYFLLDNFDHISAKSFNRSFNLEHWIFNRIECLLHTWRYDTRLEELLRLLLCHSSPVQRGQSCIMEGRRHSVCTIHYRGRLSLVGDRIFGMGSVGDGT